MLETARLCGDRLSLRVDAGRTQILNLKMNSAGDWNKLEVISNTKAAEGHQRILLSGGVVHPTYSVPGQYVKIRKDSSQEKPGFFAMANAPGGSDRLFEFLIKRTDGSAWICDASEGSVLDVSPAQGKGYPYSTAFTKDISEVILLATGSGIAPLKAVLESRQLEPRTLRLYYGAQTPAKMAYRDLFPSWEGVARVTPVISRPEGTGWAGRQGYIQQCLLEDGLSAPERTGVLVCGVNAMVKEAKEALLQAGVPPGNILMNF